MDLPMNIENARRLGREEAGDAVHDRRNTFAVDW